MPSYKQTLWSMEYVNFTQTGYVSDNLEINGIIILKYQ